MIFGISNTCSILQPSSPFETDGLLYCLVAGTFLLNWASAISEQQNQYAKLPLQKRPYSRKNKA